MKNKLFSLGTILSGILPVALATSCAIYVDPDINYGILPYPKLYGEKLVLENYVKPGPKNKKTDISSLPQSELDILAETETLFYNKMGETFFRTLPDRHDYLTYGYANRVELTFKEWNGKTINIFIKEDSDIAYDIKDLSKPNLVEAFKFHTVRSVWNLRDSFGDPVKVQSSPFIDEDHKPMKFGDGSNLNIKGRLWYWIKFSIRRINDGER